MTLQTKHQRVNNLIAEIRDLKTKVDFKYQEESTVREKMNNFLAQYQSYLGELDKQVEDFFGKIANARMQIEELNRPTETPQEEQDALDDVSNFQSESEDNKGAIDPNLPSASDTNEPEEIITEETDIPLEPDEKIKKEDIRKHFARFWHPDHSSFLPTENEGYMTVLNTAFNEATDSADLLAAIPWDDRAWEKRKAGESIGEQWERLTDWHTALEIASGRLDQKLASVKNDWQYPLFSDWDKDTEKHTFFTGLADNKRDEIKRLEETLQTLKHEIETIQAERIE